MKVLITFLVTYFAVARSDFKTELASLLQDLTPEVTHALQEGSHVAGHLLHHGLEGWATLVRPADNRRETSQLTEEVRQKLEIVLEEKAAGFEALMRVALARLQSIASKVDDLDFLQQPIAALSKEIDNVITGHHSLSDSLMAGITNEIKDILSGSTTSNDLDLADSFATTMKPHLNDIETAVATMGSTLKQTLGDIMSTVQQSISLHGGVSQDAISRLTNVIQTGRQTVMDVGQRVTNSLANSAIETIIKNAS